MVTYHSRGQHFLLHAISAVKKHTVPKCRSAGRPPNSLSANMLYKRQVGSIRGKMGGPSSSYAKVVERVATASYKYKKCRIRTLLQTISVFLVFEDVEN